MNDERLITLAHGNGGRRMRDLIRDVFVRHLGNDELDANADAARLRLPAGEIMITTDGFSVQPLEFPGGDIGSLAVHGTVNDLAVAGAIPVHLTLGVFIEEGFEFARLDRLVASLGRAARNCGVSIVAGDTKVLPRGDGDGLYLTTTGIGVRTQGLRLGLDAISPGDLILVSGPVGDHGTAVLLAREEFGLSSDLASDAASVLPLTRALVDLPGLHFMRDPTRGGLATVAHEIAVSRNLSMRLREADIPAARSGALGLRNARLRSALPCLRRTRRRHRHAGGRVRLRWPAGALCRRARMPGSSAPSRPAARRSCSKPNSAASGSSRNSRTNRCRASVDDEARSIVTAMISMFPGPSYSRRHTIEAAIHGERVWRVDKRRASDSSRPRQ